MADEREIHSVTVRGIDVDGETRCAHYGTERDVVAIRFACCGDYYPCFECHAALTDHAVERWPSDAFDAPAVLCGRCGAELSVRAYLDCEHACPACGESFNPGCARHAERYFER